MGNTCSEPTPVRSNITSKKLDNQSISRTRIVENFIIVWLDANINKSNSDIQNSLNQLQHTVNTIKIFTDIESCVNFLHGIEHEKVFLIVSGSLGQQILPTIQHNNQLDSVYIFCHDLTKHATWVKQYKKIKGMFNGIEPLCEKLKSDIRQRDKDLTPVSIVSTKSDELDQSFMYSQLLKDILLRLPFNDQAKKDLVEFCRGQYSKNKYELKIIDEFERDYDRPSPIWWYTRECFTYTMLNKALRTQDIEIIIKMGFFVRDLHRQLEELHSKMDKNTQLIVYRGQGMLNAEFEKMKANQGGLLSFNNFLSTSTTREVSLGFARCALNNQDLTAILFQMNIDPSISTTPFACLDNLSYFSDSEKEILFSMHTIFRIDEIKQLEERLWEVHLKLTSDNDEQLAKVTEQMKTEIAGGTDWHALGHLMTKIDRFDKAEEVYKTLLETTDKKNSKDIAQLYHQLGYVNKQRDNLSDALIYYKKSLELKLTYLPKNDPGFSATYSNIGSVLLEQRDLNGALNYYQHALQIDLHAPEPDQLEIATDYNNIAQVLMDQRKHTDALKHFQNALNIFLEKLPPRHPSIGVLYNNIGDAYRVMGDRLNAHSSYKKSFEILEKSLPANHRTLTIVHDNMTSMS
ncbi:unnamed protein product [Adineta steineri]|uniref:ADP ribosyltransferase domain-containing protein n=1 Tax=Adineta steineri TaxID=433720 RepID=A0A814K6D5_9BILA|nr:unnamed protein product [Adineta steineri]CAF3555692.1 unnamed protein product [Adineta steineri]